MIRSKRVATAGVAVIAALSLAACSSSGGRQSSSGTVSTPKMTVAMITHAAPGDTFWDIVRKGAEAAAAKDNITIQYSYNDDATQQAQLIQSAIDKKVEGIAVTDPDTPALGGVIKKAVASGITVSMFNAGSADALQLGAVGYFGQEEKTAGQAAGARAVQEGAKHILCVDQTAGQQQLEDRCAGLRAGAVGATVDEIYVNGTDDSAVTTSIQAKLTQDPSIDLVMTLGAPISLDAVKSVTAAGSKVKVATFDTNAAVVGAIKSGSVEWAIDQQPFLEGYLAIDSIWLYMYNRNTIGGGGNTPTGPSFVDSKNVDIVAKYATRGTR